jgi:RNA 3'-terminal phosphate cyclase (ATP)/RNA 3'-terminal phosphate cyclase (GTP)
MTTASLLEIDGSHGEGGGQLLRTAVALSVISAQPLRIVNIRIRRANPGLAPQHLTAVKALAEVCGAEVEGLAPKSLQLSFRPGPIRAGTYEFDVGTAGSITLVLQALLPVAVSSGQAFSFRIRGGTDVRGAPPMDYLRYVLLPLLARLGAVVRVDILRRGYYPRGGGDVQVDIAPCPGLRPLMLEAQGDLQAIRGYVHVANLPEHIALRMAQAAREVLNAPVPTHLAHAVLGWDEAIGMGGGILLAACCAHTTLGASALAQRGVPAERLGEEAARELRATLASGATLDLHAADQLLVYLALASGPSRFHAQALSSHAETALWLIGQFLPMTAQVAPAGQGVAVTIRPR